ncbi:MAG: MarR family transcriptional regulator [Kangiellaceae bacterium]|nr:MarR family transcriptional regulator [Kangiellaceae bacterium]
MNIKTQQTELAFSLVKLNTRILKRLDSPLSLHGINLSEFMVLRNLSQAPNQTTKRIELAESVGLTASGVTRLLLPMEKIGLVQKQKNPRDARVSLVRLTTAGQGILDDATNTFELSSANLFESFGSAELSDLLGLINKL